MDAEDLITQAKGTSPNIKELLDLVKPFQSSHETLSSLHDDLDVLKQVVKTLQEDKDGFLSHNAKYQPKLLEECHHLLKGSKIICSELYGEFKGAMQQSAIWSGVNQHEIQNNVLRNTPILVGLRIWILRLDLTVKFMQFLAQTYSGKHDWKVQTRIAV
ncbi:hypothetical protein TRIATDRAFT_86640 [Trichoderma atroviride IMI 206040]|uniref:Fungal N-terminal domain-containing protein n=1 Tax=Hypocrea atroviridis (strain ATCC 20476 / IMI 206040) TaxID=452589 RepID=G9P162_HYPAI|nr:uncharacterized protein TRIATDRAFT_86640 [Trichoderma atroviride IMI 206040]EHK42470.1 hypothetical protein TRIATDRAFT_86640 [Trichoderma atroviride IMI 206040]